MAAVTLPHRVVGELADDDPVADMLEQSLDRMGTDYVDRVRLSGSDQAACGMMPLW